MISRSLAARDLAGDRNEFVCFDKVSHMIRRQRFAPRGETKYMEDKFYMVFI